MCTNLPIVWHMWRKHRKAQSLLPGSSLFKSKQSSAMTPSSHASRRSRFARSLGLSNADHSTTDSQTRTILAAEEGQSTYAESHLTHPDRALYFGKVERIHTQDMSEVDVDGDMSSKRTRSTSISGASSVHCNHTTCETFPHYVRCKFDIVVVGSSNNLNCCTGPAKSRQC